MPGRKSLPTSMHMKTKSSTSCSSAYADSAASSAASSPQRSARGRSKEAAAARERAQSGFPGSTADVLDEALKAKTHRTLWQERVWV